MIRPSETTYWSAVDAAPLSLRDVLASSATATSLENLYERMGLPVAQREKISALVGFLLVGILPLRMFLEELRGVEGIDLAAVTQIAQDIRREILAPVAHDLAALQPQAEQNYAAAMSEMGSAPVQQPAPDTSVQQGPPLPPTPPTPPQSATPPAAS